MNHFTKEELELIYESIYFNELEHHLQENIPESSIKLLDKIQSMIDRYCEHQLCHVDTKVNPLRCCKCGVTVL